MVKLIYLFCPDGVELSKVEFYKNNELIGTDETIPFEI